MERRVKKLLILASIAVLAVSCKGSNRGSHTRDAELTQVVTEVSKDLEQRGVDTSPMFSKVDSWEFDEQPYTGDNGSCKHSDNDTLLSIGQPDTGNHIKVNRYYWSDLNDLSRRALLAHEFGHCAWNKSHEASGIMYEHGYSSLNTNGYGNLIDSFAVELGGYKIGYNIDPQLNVGLNYQIIDTDNKELADELLKTKPGAELLDPYPAQTIAMDKIENSLDPQEPIHENQGESQ